MKTGLVATDVRSETYSASTDQKYHENGDASTLVTLAPFLIMEKFGILQTRASMLVMPWINGKARLSILPPSGTRAWSPLLRRVAA
jgi:hypothetical protein